MPDILARRMACMAQHTGLWCIQPEWLQTMVLAVNAGLLEGSGRYAHLAAENDQVREALAAKPRHDDIVESDAAATEIREKRRQPFTLDESGIAVIEIVGPMMKGSSKLSANANTIGIRRAVRAAVEDPDVLGIMLVVDSPGGTTAGTAELANDIRQAAERKPVRVHADDLMASAAVWATAAAHKITASPASEVGSIGTILVVHDMSERAATEGIKVHVVSTGMHKGTGVPGTEVDEAQLVALRERVEDINGHFQESVRDGRGLSGGRLEAVSDGRVFIADKAKAMGLVDEVQTFDDAMQSFRRSVTRSSRGRAARSAIIDQELRAAQR